MCLRSMLPALKVRPMWGGMSVRVPSSATATYSSPFSGTPGENFGKACALRGVAACGLGGLLKNGAAIHQMMSMASP